MDSNKEKYDLGTDPSLLLVDDDEPFVKRLARAMERRGFKVRSALTVTQGKQLVESSAPGYAVIDLRLEDGSGLEVVELIRAKRSDARIIVLTGYGAIATTKRPVRTGIVSIKY